MGKRAAMTLATMALGALITASVSAPGSKPRVYAEWPEILTPAGVVRMHRDHGARIDPHGYAMVRGLYPDTTLVSASDDSAEGAIVFTSIVLIGRVATPLGAMLIVGVERAITGMLAPRGLSDVLVLGPRGEKFADWGQCCVGGDWELVDGRYLRHQQHYIDLHEEKIARSLIDSGRLYDLFYTDSDEEAFIPIAQDWPPKKE